MPEPDAPTTPTAPRRTALAKPSGTPSRRAVPQSGPITSRPFSAASVLRRTSSSTLTPLLKTMTSRPASSARRASRAAKAPGTDTSARRASGSAARPSARVRGASSVTPSRAPPVPWVRAASSASMASRASVACAVDSASTTINRSSGFGGEAHPGGARPIRPRVSRLRGVHMMAAARRTPGRPSRARARRMRVPESRYSSGRSLPCR